MIGYYYKEKTVNDNSEASKSEMIKVSLTEISNVKEISGKGGTKLCFLLRILS